MSIQEKKFGQLESGEAVSLFVLTNKNGLTAQITNYGGILVALHVPDRDGKLADITLGKDTLQDYLEGHPHFGAITGRVAGRITNAQFTLEGETYKLAANNSTNCLHGGTEGFDKKLWKAEIVDDSGNEKLRLSLVDPDGSNGFPGTVECEVTYALRYDDTLEINYKATTDKATPFNLTNHAYFNLKGEGNGDILGHRVQIFSDAIASCDPSGTLLGSREPLTEGYNDYRKPVTLKDLPTLEVGNADNHFFLAEGRTAQPKPAAIVSDPDSGRIMEVYTTEPGVQFYAGLSLSEKGPESGKGDKTYGAKTGLCFETQDYPDSISFPMMGNAILKPEDTFKSTTLFRFSTTKD